MSKDKVVITKKLEHPLEKVFGIEPGTTVITREEQQTNLVEAPHYDEKDSEIEEAIQTVYDKAMSTYDFIQDECEDIEGRYLPRMMEVGSQHLKVALDAAQARARMKESKDKNVGKNGGGPQTVNNNIVISREELLRTMFEGDYAQEDDDNVVNND